MSEYFPTVVQVIPYEDYTVDIYFDDGKIVCYDAKKDLSPQLFDRIKDIEIFMGTCTILNRTLAWDIAGGRNECECIDIDPFTLYKLKRFYNLLIEKIELCKVPLENGQMGKSLFL